MMGALNPEIVARVLKLVSSVNTETCDSASSSQLVRTLIGLSLEIMMFGDVVLPFIDKVKCSSS